jgi:hypothetical protein
MPYTIADLQSMLEAEAGSRVALGKLGPGLAVRVTALIRQHPDRSDPAAAARWWRVSSFPPDPIGWGYLASGNNFADAVAKGRQGARPSRPAGGVAPAPLRAMNEASARRLEELFTPDEEPS